MHQRIQLNFWYFQGLLARSPLSPLCLQVHQSGGAPPGVLGARARDAAGGRRHRALPPARWLARSPQPSDHVWAQLTAGETACQTCVYQQLCFTHIESTYIRLRRVCQTHLVPKAAFEILFSSPPCTAFGEVSGRCSGRACRCRRCRGRSAPSAPLPGALERKLLCIPNHSDATDTRIVASCNIQCSMSWSTRARYAVFREGTFSYASRRPKF